MNFLDDALLLGLSRLGVSLPGLQTLSTAFLTATLLDWACRTIRFFYQQYSVSEFRGQS